jgi:hypothetical protein
MLVFNMEFITLKAPPNGSYIAFRYEERISFLVLLVLPSIQALTMQNSPNLTAYYVALIIAKDILFSLLIYVSGTESQPKFWIRVISINFCSGR